MPYNYLRTSQSVIAKVQNSQYLEAVSTNKITFVTKSKTMIQSMTGYGKADCELNGNKITVEIKSLNSKQLDLSIRMISSYKNKEMEIRNEIQKKLERGKVDVSIYFDNAVKENILQFNTSAF
jgi:hypothetical protein